MQRISRLQKLLKSKKISALLVTHRPNLKYLCDFGGTSGMLFLTPLKAFFITDPRYFEEAKKTLLRNVKAVEGKFLPKIKTKKIFFEEQYMTVAKLKFLKKTNRGIRFIGSQNLVESLRMQKDKNEIASIVKAQKIAEKVLAKIVKNLRVGITEKEVMIMIKKFGLEFGADETSFRPIVAFGENSSVPHHEPGNRKLQKGDIVLIDMGMKYNGYCSDMTRVFFFKTAPPEKQKQAYNLVLAAQKKILDNIRAGVSGKKADFFARKFLEKAGFAKNFLHNSGHGIGLEIHEIPTLGLTYSGKLPARAAVTVEPGIYFENSFGIRIEDMVILDSRGIRNLTRFPKNLASIIIK
ncbi:aminopeptidase P family protein [Candidatus Peregrinibacteria bacterium]|nr:aminopeptidase P family protein [Candidatus Peregrinibacteria bacterium]